MDLHTSWHLITDFDSILSVLENKANSPPSLYLSLDEDSEMSHKCLDFFSTQGGQLDHTKIEQIALSDLSSLEMILSLSHAPITVDNLHPHLPAVLFRSIRLRLMLPYDLELIPTMLGRALYTTLQHVPLSMPTRATWQVHADQSIDMGLFGEGWSVQMSAEYLHFEENQKASYLLSGTDQTGGRCLQSILPLHSADGHEHLVPWTEEVRVRWRRALSLIQRAKTSNGIAFHPVEAEIHSNASIDPSVEIHGAVQVGAHTKIWHFSKLLGPLEIGARCSLGQNVVVERGVRLGSNVKVQNNVSIYSGVILEDDVFCGPSMVFTNVGTPRSHFPRRGEYVETRVQRGASIGANATIVCGHTLGRYSFVGAGAVVTKDVPHYALVYGNPARIQGWVCYCGVRLDLGIEEGGDDEATCDHCDRKYTRTGFKVCEVDEEGSSIDLS